VTFTHEDFWTPQYLRVQFVTSTAECAMEGRSQKFTVSVRVLLKKGFSDSAGDGMHLLFGMF
jgi:hypothetical protein